MADDVQIVTDRKSKLMPKKQPRIRVQ